MIRLLGIMTGSAIAIATLLLFIGIPEFRSETVQAERTPVRLPRPTQPVEQAEPVAGPAASPPSPPVADPPAEGAHAGTETPPPADSALRDAEAASGDAGNDSRPGNQQPADAPLAVTPAGDGWYVFWSPFRSRIAAEGFVARLQSVTGLDYRIIRREPGAWEVSFSYADDRDITRHLAQISAATGLELAEAP